MGGQSYGSILAQAYLALRPERVQRLVLSSAGPADYGPLWAPVEQLVVCLARVLPARRVKSLLAGWLARVFSTLEGERAERLEAMRETVAHDLTRDDVVSQFAVAGDLFRRRIVRRGAYAGWPDRVVILSAENDPAQGKSDRARFEAPFGRPMEVLSLGAMGHTAAISDPDRYVEILEQALA